jgi:hypothetical protein
MKVEPVSCRKPVQASVTHADAYPLNFAPVAGLIVAAGQNVSHTTLFLFPLPSSTGVAKNPVRSVLLSRWWPNRDLAERFWPVMRTVSPVAQSPLILSITRLVAGFSWAEAPNAPSAGLVGSVPMGLAQAATESTSKTAGIGFIVISKGRE